MIEEVAGLVIGGKHPHILGIYAVPSNEAIPTEHRKLRYIGHRIGGEYIGEIADAQHLQKGIELMLEKRGGVYPKLVFFLKRL